MAGDGKFYYGVGRRKTASAQVRIYPQGDGAIVINGKPLDEFFPRAVDQDRVRGPLEAVGMGGVNVTALVRGGGITGQSGAVMLGVARALVLGDDGLRGPLKAGGFLTRDPREKERKKPGLKRARKAPQYTKR